MKTHQGIELSEYLYEYALKILEFVTTNPGTHAHRIAEFAGLPKVTVQAVCLKIERAGCFTHTTQKYRGGRRYYYKATGLPLPNRTLPVSKRKRFIEQTQTNSGFDVFSANDALNMPKFMRALASVTEVEPVNASTFLGHTKDQHKKQSKLIRAEYRAAHRGAIYTGESRL